MTILNVNMEKRGKMTEHKIVRYLKPIMNEGMEKDLIFYLDHDKQLYFSGMVVIAAVWFVFIGAFWVASLFAVSTLTGLILLGMSLIGLLGFQTIKMYLHVRKDAIEIMELLKGGTS